MSNNSVNKRYVPKLRFRGFEGEYSFEILNKYLEYEQPTKYLILNNENINEIGNVPVLTANKSFILGYVENELNNCYKKGECFVFDDFTTDIKYVNFLFKLRSSATKIITTKNDNYINYFFYLLKSKKPEILGHKRHWIEITSKEKRFIPPTLKEQEKISIFLSLLDKQISLLENKLKLTETLLKFNIANFFKKTSKIYNFINFKKIVILNKNKNKSNHHYDVATISNKFGFIRQKEYFGDKTNVASEDKKNYYIIERKSFGFNPARINVGSFGYYNKNEKLLISPIYVSFKINNEIFHDEIIEAYSKTYFFKQNIAKWQTGSVRKSINANDFLNFTIPLIPLKIQNVFVNKKNLLEKHILCLNKKIETLKQRKMFYLENLFI